MSETRRYTGGCHCGKVRYEVELDLGPVVECNCSICGKTGTLLAFAPVDKFRLVSGDDSLTDYQFGKKNVHHNFCRVCGIRSFAKGRKPDGTEMRAINVRCLDDIDVWSLTVNRMDGKSR